MFERWLLKDFAPGEGERAGAHARDLPADGWIEAAVPGDVHVALIAAGRISDPFYDRNEEACRWVEDREWWYRTELEVGPDGKVAEPAPSERVEVVFEGLDVFASVWLDGRLLGRTENAFREYRFDVTSWLVPGRHTLAVSFEPPLVRLAGTKALDFPGRMLRGEKRMLMRVPQFGYGWDWGPRLPQIGIWRPVRLRRSRLAAIAGIHFATEWVAADASEARASVEVDVERVPGAGTEPLETTVELVAPDGRTVASGSTEGSGRHAFTFELERPAVWWTHDLGEPALHTLWVTLAAGGETVDVRQLRVGVRTIALDQAPDRDEPGTRFFRFLLNGRSIFARGANWIPADSFPGRVTPERYERLVGDAREANMTMLRVWGGGIYEADAFYEACDRHGILVWQDFMFANAPYPEDEAFAAKVRAEIAGQIRRLRNHPSLALWCGNNEIEWTLDQIVQVIRRRPKLHGAAYYDELMPALVAELDGHTPYWTSSPWSDFDGARPNDRRQGDTHDWTVWHGVEERPSLKRLVGVSPKPEQVAFTRYAEDDGRFVSEFGIHAAPVLETLRRVVPKDQLYHHSPSLDHHNKDNPKNKLDLLMVPFAGEPSTLDDFVAKSMLTQAEGLKFGIEHFRRRRPHCSGALIWQLNDCWPCQSWSVVDYYGFKKAGYFYARRAFSPLLASFEADGDDAALWITNDSPETVEDEATVRLGVVRFQSKGMERPLFEETVAYTTEPGESRAIWERGAVRLGPANDRAEVYLSVRSAGDRFPVNRLHFVPFRQRAARSFGGPDYHVATRDGALVVDLLAPRYVDFVTFFVPDEAATYSDNYFDMEAGERRSITVTSPNPLDPDALEVSWFN